MGNFLKDIFGVFRVAAEEKLLFAVFCLFNLAFGAMALWAPPLFASLTPRAHAGSEFVDALLHGHGYFYSLAILSASFPYWLREFRRSKVTEFKQLKLGTGIVTVGLVVFLALLVASLVTNEMHKEDALEGTSLVLEVLCTIVSIAVTAYLFCLEHIDDYPTIGIKLRDKNVERISLGMDSESSSGINLGE